MTFQKFLRGLQIALNLIWTRALLGRDARGRRSSQRRLIAGQHRPPNATVIKVASGQSNSSFHFGDVFIVDDKVTSDQDPDTPEVGRLQGIVVFASTTTLETHLSATLVFSKGEWIGSSLSLLGIIKASEKVNEFAIVGGTRMFQFSRGYAKYAFVSSNTTSGVSTGALNIVIRNN
ncbi:hypothetical protein HPP92_018262 [Vanilla planifolia]|uniref:Dirigent protein n=1 Tax=Vanilla planifolia TaxID=51239 RepID=A0A835QCH1_VANPL|nr:hypothetical protein HPP92_018262 [Vanilla planifolia]